MKHRSSRLRLQREAIRSLATSDLHIAAGLEFSNPAVSCDSCTNCTCKPPG